MKISFPSSGPTNFITVPDPEFRDQTQINIATTFKRMVDGSITPFNHLPAQGEISVVFNTLKYKKAREFLDFLLLGNNQEMIFESDSGTSGEFLDAGTVLGTVVTDPIALVTINDLFKSMAFSISLQKTIPLSAKHRGSAEGNQSVLGDCTTFYLVGGESTLGLLDLNDAYARFDGFDGFWSEQTSILAPSRSRAVGFSLLEKIYVTSGTDGSVSLGKINAFLPALDAKGVWFSVSSTMGTARLDATGFEFELKGYIIGGELNGTLVSCIEVFDPTTETWSNGQEQGCLGIKNAYSFSTTDFSYFGGGDTGSVSDVLNRFDGLAWSIIKSDPLLAVTNGFATGYASENKGLIFGGEDSTAITLSATTEYDELTNALLVGGVLPTVVKNHTGASLGSAMCSVSGEDSLGVSIIGNNEYSFVDNTWAVRTGTPTPSRKDAVSPCNNSGGLTLPEGSIPTPDLIPPPASYVVITGGQDLGSVPSNSTYKWDFGLVTANVLWDMPSNRIAHQQASIGGSVFIADGEQNLNKEAPIEAFWEFTINDIWFDRTLRGEFYDSQPRGSDFRDPRSRGTMESFDEELFLSYGATGYPLQYSNMTLNIDKWNASEGWKLSLSVSGLSSSWDAKVDIASAVWFGKVTTLAQDLDGNTITQQSNSGLIMYVCGRERGFPFNAVSETFPPFISNQITQYSILFNTMFNLGAFIFASSNVRITNINGDIYSYDYHRWNGTGLVYIASNRQYQATLDTWWTYTTFPVESSGVTDFAESNTSQVDVGACFGGRTAFAGPTSSAIRTLNVTTKVWSTDVGVLPTVYMNQLASPINNSLTPSAVGRLFSTDGITSGAFRAKTFIFTPATLDYSIRSEHGRTKSKPIVEYYDNAIYVIGRGQGQTELDGGVLPFDESTTSFDTVLTVWRELTLSNLDIGMAREGAVSGEYNGEIISLGGFAVAKSVEYDGFAAPFPPQVSTDYQPVNGNYFNNFFHKYDVGNDAHIRGGTPEYLYQGYSSGTGTLAGSEMFKLGGLVSKRLLRRVTPGGSRDIIPFNVLFDTFMHHDSWDISIWLAPTKTDRGRSFIQSDGIYANVNATRNVYIGGLSVGSVSRKQDTRDIDLISNAWTLRTEHFGVRDLSGSYFDGHVFFTSGEFASVQNDPFNNPLRTDTWAKKSSMYKYEPFTFAYSNLGIVVVEGVNAEGQGRSATSF